MFSFYLYTTQCLHVGEGNVKMHCIEFEFEFEKCYQCVLCPFFSQRYESYCTTRVEFLIILVIWPFTAGKKISNVNVIAAIKL